MAWQTSERIWYRCGHALSTLITAVLFRPKITGRDNIPRDGAVIIAPNHRSMIDIPALGCTTRRPLRFMAKKELFKNRFVKWYFETNGSFSVDKEGSDPAAVRKAVRYLHGGDALVVFPEGKRNKGDTIGELSPGVGFLAVKSQAPVVPVGISGVDSLRKKGSRFALSRAHIVVGTPIDIHLRSEGKTSERSEALMRELEVKLSELFEQSKLKD
jgi:1-acyl-sn-glycerol-3-phosphate acyltransferase